ncbi:unnamed protein product [Litomosoides sigmodontis]|uniref:Uncharacterized protein n=1 Tax=Litomosoides sigmodontis TaxID=42156 RepID=A0A3P6TA60_LITSI|nr:unnamed protein product [Litomosoides sigmodontis]
MAVSVVPHWKLLFYFDKVNTSNQHYDYDEIEESIAVAVENYNKSTRHPTRSTKRCVRYDEKYLSQVLERSGMLNQWFMANNPEDAGRNFARCYKNLFKTKFDSVDLPQDDSLRFKVDDIDVPFACNDLCQNITWRLNEALRNEKNDTILLNAPFSDDAEISSTLTNCQLGKFIPVGNCIPQGAEEFEEHSKLCTSCHGIYMLAHGSCYMRTLTLNVLRNEGSEKCQEWYHEYIEVPTSCECQLDAESLLLSAVKP